MFMKLLCMPSDKTNAVSQLITKMSDLQLVLFLIRLQVIRLEQDIFILPVSHEDGRFCYTVGKKKRTKLTLTVKNNITQNCIIRNCKNKRMQIKLKKSKSRSSESNRDHPISAKILPLQSEIIPLDYSGLFYLFFIVEVPITSKMFDKFEV